MEDYCKISRWEVLKQKLNNLTPEAFKEGLERDDNIILADCRKPSEFESGHLEGAINMDYLGEDFYDKMESLDPKKNYYVYCRSGRRSLRTCTLMQNSGFENIYNLDGGLNGWTKVFGIENIIINTPT